jgi:nicotinamide mononucleotide transporter
MSSIEIIAVLFSLMCVLLSIKRNILNWPVGLVGVSAYALLFYREKLYADVALQVFFFVQGIYGWITWRLVKNRDHDILIERLSGNQQWLYGLAIICITSVWAYGLMTLTDASVPWVDAFAATTSFFANLLMARRKMESWLLWITADVVYIGLFAYKALYLSSGIYVVFLIMAILGLWKWKQKSLGTASH